MLETLSKNLKKLIKKIRYHYLLKHMLPQLIETYVAI